MNTKRRYISLEERKFIEANIHLPISQIAKALGRKPKSVSYEIKHKSVNGVYSAEKAHELAYLYFGNKVKNNFGGTKPVTEHEIAKIKELAQAGYTFTSMSKMLGVSRNRIQRICRNLGIEVQESKLDELNAKLISLQDQVKILFEMIKQIQNKE